MEPRRRFVNEAKAAAELDHPVIVTVFDAGSSYRFLQFAKWHVECGRLADIPRDGRLPLRRAAELGRKVRTGCGLRSTNLRCSR